ncbi:MAG TPA: hypothetical protein PKE40_07030 [Arachnia sp.]|nr:hypothetical protein [Arachnia sp.]HMT86089.1 hypothetical protein [Arachnia sp.]
MFLVLLYAWTAFLLLRQMPSGPSRSPAVCSPRCRKDAYRAFIGGFAPMLTGLGDIAEFTDGDRVALFYYPQTAATSTAPAAEFFTVEDGKIATSVLIFDRLSYGPPGQD